MPLLSCWYLVPSPMCLFQCVLKQPHISCYKYNSMKVFTQRNFPMSAGKYVQLACVEVQLVVWTTYITGFSYYIFLVSFIRDVDLIYCDTFIVLLLPCRSPFLMSTTSCRFSPLRPPLRAGVVGLGWPPTTQAIKKLAPPCVHSYCREEPTGCVGQGAECGEKCCGCECVWRINTRVFYCSSRRKVKKCDVVHATSQMKTRIEQAYVFPKIPVRNMYFLFFAKIS